jgi:Domain of unknown function (DUF1918)
MAFEVGKRVVAESESTGRRPRSGVVEEVLRGDPSPRYRIRWDDGHESIYTPRKRRSPSRTTPQEAAASVTTETQTNLRRGRSTAPGKKTRRRARSRLPDRGPQTTKPTRTDCPGVA